MVKRMFFVVLFLSSASLNAGVYRWVDAEGHTHFGDRPPAEIAPTELVTKSDSSGPNSTDRNRQQKINAFLEQKKKEREAQQAASAKADQQAVKLAARCRKLNARLKYMDSISTFYNLNDQGERVFVSESENKQIRERFQNKVQGICGR